MKIYRDNYAIAQTERRLGKEEGLAEGKAAGAYEKLGEVVRRMRAKGFDNAAIAGILNESPDIVASF